MTKTHTVTVEDFHFHQVMEELAASYVKVSDGRDKRKRLIFFTFPSNPGQFHYEVRFGIDETKTFRDIENAITAYNEIK